MDDLKLFSRSKKGLDSLVQTVRVFGEDIGMEGESYKYLGVLEADQFLEEKMKLNDSKEYIRKLRNVLKSKLNGGNLVYGLNTWEVSLSRYSAAFVSWRKRELQVIDRTIRKLFTIYGDYTLSQMETDYLYLEKKEEEV